MADQHRLNLLLARVIRQAKAIGVPISPRISPQVAINPRAKTRLGCCRNGPAGHTIEVSALLCAAREADLLQVLAHEVLHTCPGCANHGRRWQGWAARMAAAYGYQIRRTCSYQSLGLPDPRPVRYLVVCCACGLQLPRMRRSPLVNHPERYRCRCGGRLEVLPQGPPQAAP